MKQYCFISLSLFIIQELNWSKGLFRIC